MKRRLLLGLALVPVARLSAEAPPDELLALAELVGGRPLPPDAHAAIAAAAAAAMRRDPEGQARGRGQVSAFLAPLRDADPVARARLRIHARQTLWFDWKDGDGEAVRQAAFALDPVIAADPRRRLVVTGDEVVALLAANALCGEIVGIAPPAANRPALVAELAQQFAGWPQAAQRGFAEASLRRAILERAWQAMPATRREAVADRARDRVREARAVPAFARALEAAAAAGLPLESFGRPTAVLPRIGAQLGIVAGMSGALR
jgi:hypothetical protein